MFFWQCRQRCDRDSRLDSCRGRHWPAALHLFRSIGRPTAVSYNAILSALPWRMALDTFQEMLRKALQPDAFTTTALVCLGGCFCMVWRPKTGLIGLLGARTAGVWVVLSFISGLKWLGESTRTSREGDQEGHWQAALHLFHLRSDIFSRFDL